MHILKLRRNDIEAIFTSIAKAEQNLNCNETQFGQIVSGNMTKTTKILLTLPSVLGLSYMLILGFPTEFHWFVPSMKAYYIQIGTLQALTIIQLVILIRKLWSFKNIEKSKKRDWTWLLIIFNSITSLIFIWKRADEFEELNNKNSAAI